MYDYLNGTLQALKLDKAILDVNGVGYFLYIPSTQISKFPKIGAALKLFTAFVVREDSQRLFGFLSEKERDLFLLFSDVSGIGPKTALALIAHLSLESLEIALATKDVRLLSKVPGIGKKTAERLILELSDRMKKRKDERPSHFSEASSPHLKDAILALQNLGYSSAAAERAAEKADQEKEEETTLSELIKSALKKI
ncbi:MAG: Holliday junction branch migration protein RuvA [Simkaniaceae bacterium]